MAAYAIYHQTNVTDPEAYRQRYLGPARDSVVKFGGRQLAGGSENFEVLEGAWEGPRVVIHEFPDMESLKRWYNSEEFKPLIKIRQSISEGNFIAVEGFEN